MKKTFKLENLDCANCAAKMEHAINKLGGISASINFMSQRLTLEAADESFEQAVESAQKCMKRVEPGCKIIR